MAKRDVQLVVRAKDEASRALNHVAGIIGQLNIEQKGAAASGSTFAASIVETVQQMAQLERATGLIVAASNRAEAAIDRQRAGIKQTATELAAVTRQLESAQAVIDRQQVEIVSTLRAGGDASEQIANTKAAQQAARDLETQQDRLTLSLTQQQATLTEQERHFRELASGANTAEAALASFGSESDRTNLQTTAAAEEAARALRDQAAAQDEANRATDAASFFGGSPRGLEETTGIRARETALADLIRAEDAEAQALQRLQDRINPLSVVERKLAADTALLEKAFKDGRIDAKQFENQLASLKAEAQATSDALGRRGRGEAGRPSLLGLKPYELTNLGYQVNDVLTQLASGTNPMQVLAQQGGQILQLLPGLSGKLIGLFTNPYFLGAAGPVIALGVAIREASTDAQRLRTMEAMLNTIGEDAGVTAEELAAVAESIERIGLSADESTALVRSFLTEGLNLEYLQQFAQAARDFSDVTGTEIPDALEKQRQAFTAGYDEVAKLDDAVQFLTLAEREQIRAMFESGDAASAREQAFNLFSDEMDQQANKARGEWSGSVRALDKAFGDLVDTLGNTDFATGFLETLEYMANGIEEMLVKIEDADLELVERRIALLEEAERQFPRREGDTAISLFGNTREEELAALRERREELLRLGDATGDLVDAESEARRKSEADQLALIRRENELANARTSAQRIALEGEQAYQDAVNAGHSERVAQARREQAIARQRREEDRRAEQERRRQEDEFARRIEGNGRDQLVQTARQFEGRNENNRADANVLSEFFRAANINIDPEMVAWCAAFVNAVLATNGLPTVDEVTSGSDLRARDFLGYGSEVARPEPGDIVILKGANGPGSGHVGFFQGFEDNGDVRVLGGNQSDGVNTQTFRSKDVLGFRRPPSQGDVAEDQFKEEQRRLDQQRAFNLEIDEENEARRRNTEFLRSQIGLSGEALLDAERQQAVEETIAEARQKAARNELDLSAERLAAIEATVRAEFDIANARERAAAALDDAAALRDALVGQLALAEETGNTSAIRSIESELERVDAAMVDAIRRAQDFFAQFDNPQAAARVRELGTQLERLERDRLTRARQRVETPVAQLQAQRNALLEQANFFRDLGETAVADQLREQVRAVDRELLGAIDTAIAFWQAQGGPEAQAAILNYQNLRNQVMFAQNEFVITARQLQDAFAGSLYDAVDTFAQRLVETRDPLEALAVGALQFAADFTRKLAEMGLEIVAFKLASKIGFGDVANGFNSVLGNSSVAVSASALAGAGAQVLAGGSAISTGAIQLGFSAKALLIAAKALTAANAAGAGVFHGGGIAGSANRTRAVSPLWFMAATRYHSGGVAGLRPNEVPTILERGEEILTRADPRHRFNGQRGDGESYGPRRSRSEILAIGDREIAEAMNSASGDEVVLKILRRNRETVRSITNE